MAKDDRDILQVLKDELNFLEHGRYHRGTWWRVPFIFEDSPTCLKYFQPQQPHKCEECVLMQFVPPEHRYAISPCRHIPLNEEKQTLDSLYRSGTQPELEEGLRKWLLSTIERLEQERAQKKSA